MRPQKIDDQELLSRIFSVVREKGYDGASISELAELTGLKKASLYHRFPGGKKDIVKAVLEDVDNWSQKNLVSVLSDPKKSAEERLDKTISNLNELYQNGEKTCIYRSLSLDSGLNHFRDELQFGINTWIKAFADFGEGIGLKEKEAREKASEAIANIQGSLMVSKILGDASVWKRSLEKLKETYID